MENQNLTGDKVVEAAYDAIDALVIGDKWELDKEVNRAMVQAMADAVGGAVWAAYFDAYGFDSPSPEVFEDD